MYIHTPVKTQNLKKIRNIKLLDYTKSTNVLNILLTLYLE